MAATMMAYQEATMIEDSIKLLLVHQMSMITMTQLMVVIT